jgi:hypothetical protein
MKSKKELIQDIREYATTYTKIFLYPGKESIMEAHEKLLKIEEDLTKLYERK